jgi:TonB family protein
MRLVFPALALLALAAATAAPAAAQPAADSLAVWEGGGVATDTAGLAMPELIGGLGALVRTLDYPREAEAAGAEGRVVVSFVVTEEGTVEEAEVTAPVHPALDQAALAAVRFARFIPAHRDGRPIRVRLALPITFDLPAGTR